MAYTVTTLGRNAQVLVSETQAVRSGYMGFVEADHLTDVIETDGWTKAFVEFHTYAAGDSVINTEYRIKAWSYNNSSGTEPFRSSAEFWYNDRPPLAFQEGTASKQTSAWGDRTTSGILVHLPPQLAFSIEAKDYSYLGEYPPNATWAIKITLQK